jgi:hypothetical protein
MPGGEHTLHGDAAAIRALLLVPRFGLGSFVVGSTPQTAAHVNFVFESARRSPGVDEVKLSEIDGLCCRVKRC